jgi:hypothetical protein
MLVVILIHFAAQWIISSLPFPLGFSSIKMQEYRAILLAPPLLAQPLPLGPALAFGFGRSW